MLRCCIVPCTDSGIPLNVFISSRKLALLLLNSDPFRPVCCARRSDVQTFRHPRSHGDECEQGITSPADVGGRHTFYSSSLSSSSSSTSASAFLAVFFFFFLFLLLELAAFAMGCSKIFKTSSSVIFLSVLNDSRFGVGGALKRVRPFLVMATENQYVAMHASFSQCFHLLPRPNVMYLPTVVNRRETGSLSLSPMTSYCRMTPPRTHSTTPTLAARSSSS